jgi:hypothetical protein
MADDSNLVIQIVADATGVPAGVQQVEQQVKNLGATVGTTTVSAKDFAAALKETGNSLGSITPAMIGAASATGNLAPAAVVASHGMAGITREMIVLGREGISGNFSRLPGSLLVLTNRMMGAEAGAVSFKTVFGLLGNLMGTIFNPTILAIVAVSVGLELLFRTLREGFGGADEAVKQHAALVKDIETAYGQAATAALKLETVEQGILGFRALKDAQTTASALNTELYKLTTSFTLMGSVGNAALDALIGKFTTDLQNGSADVTKFRSDLSNIAVANPTLAATVNYFIELTNTAEKLEVQAKQTATAIALIGQHSIPPVIAPLNSEQFATDFGADTELKQKLDAMAKKENAPGLKLANQWDAETNSLQKQTAALKAQIAAFGQSTYAVAAAETVSKLEEKATELKLKTTPQLTAQIKEMAAAYAAAKVQLQQFQERESAAEDLAHGVANAFGSFLDGTASLGDAFINLAKQIALAVIEALIFKAIMTALGFTGVSAGSGIGGFIGNLAFGGGMAAGGPLEMNKWYVAGEHGPEPIWGGGTGAFASGYGGGSGGGAMSFGDIHIHGAGAAVTPAMVMGALQRGIRDGRRLGKF